MKFSYKNLNGSAIIANFQSISIREFMIFKHQWKDVNTLLIMNKIPIKAAHPTK